MQKVSFEEVVEKIVARDPRYHQDAYTFVRDALEYTQKLVHKGEQGRGRMKERNVTGRQLLDGLQAYALQQFGPLTITVLNEWGIGRCEDVGEIVFNLVDNGNGPFGVTEKDSRDDFKGGYDFVEAFCKPFWPPSKVEATTATPQPQIASKATKL